MALGDASDYQKQGETFLRETNCIMEALRAVPQTSPNWAKDQKHGTQWSITIARLSLPIEKIEYIGSIKEMRHVIEKSITFPFWTSIKAKEDAEHSMIARAKEKPKAYDVLANLYTQADTFEDFCGNCGYSEDSREAYATWKEVAALNKKIESIFTEEELAALAYIA